MDHGGPLHRLASLAGVEMGYHDAWGRPQHLSADALADLLAALGHPIDQPDAVERHIERLETAPWRCLLEPVIAVIGDNKPVATAVAAPADAASVEARWTLTLEDGRSWQGSFHLADLPIEGARDVDGQRIERRHLRLPERPPTGYHRLRVEVGEGASRRVGEATVIAAPERCYLPPDLEGGPGTWGFAAQLYALRTDRDWGVGDYGALRTLVRAAGDLGAGVVGVNPLHALFAADARRYSPYGPSSRQFLNIQYIDVTAVPEMADCGEARALAGSEDCRRRLDALRAADLIDYPGVAGLKMPVLERLHRHFRDRHFDAAGAPVSDRGQDFWRFVEEGGNELRLIAVFEALCEHFWTVLPFGTPWWEWPEPYRDCASPEVATFAAAHAERVDFHVYLQWLADAQLAAAADACREAGMAVGLYCDIALGVDAAGAEAWCAGPRLARTARLGAPPDAFNLMGQEWGLPPYRPDALREAAYEPYIRTLRAAMRHAGAVRIDHVLGLNHMFWVPAGRKPTEGGYVRNPMEELLAVIIVESWRNRCVVVGEDLGTVPDGLRERLAAAGLLSYRLFYFERALDGAIPDPSYYPFLSLVTPSTHDLPTLPGFWHGRDLDVRADLAQFPSPDDERAARHHRRDELAAMIAALARHGLLPEGFEAEGDGGREAAFVSAVYRYLAATPGRLLMVQLEDLLGLRDQANLPGTIDQHPNWRRRLPLTAEALADDRRVRDLAARLAARGGRRGRTDE